MKTHIQLIATILFTSFLFIDSSYSQAFVAGDVAEPRIYFLNDTIVVMDYDSIYHVHMTWDKVAFPGKPFGSGVFGKFDYPLIFDHLKAALNVEQFHFIPLYADDDLRYASRENNYMIPGAVHSGQTNGYMGKNTGRDNQVVRTGPIRPEWGSVKRMPHMNNIALLDQVGTNSLGYKYRTTGALFHEIGHH